MLRRTPSAPTQIQSLTMKMASCLCSSTRALSRAKNLALSRKTSAGSTRTPMMLKEAPLALTNRNALARPGIKRT